MTMSIADFQHEIGSTGLAMFPDVVPADLVARLRVDIPKRQEICRLEQEKNGL